MEEEPALISDIMAEMHVVKLEQYITTHVSVVEEINPDDNLPSITTEVAANANLEDNKVHIKSENKGEEKYNNEDNDKSIIVEGEISGNENL